MPYWRFVFSHYIKFPNNKSINVLEIGSWEGFSTSFIVHEFSVNKIYCVDTWDGDDEHTSELSFNLPNVEKNFDSNLSQHIKCVVKKKIDSYTFFSINKNFKFDLIYIDGSHFSQDVLIDSIKSFEVLNVGGIMIFDDYFWENYHNIKYDPAFGINSFLHLISGHYNPIILHRQLIIRKTSNIERKSEIIQKIAT
jgi:predicted O-methyltransferase YrrM